MLQAPLVTKFAGNNALKNGGEMENNEERVAKGDEIDTDNFMEVRILLLILQCKLVSAIHSVRSQGVPAKRRTSDIEKVAKFWAFSEILIDPEAGELKPCKLEIACDGPSNVKKVVEVRNFLPTVTKILRDSPDALVDKTARDVSLDHRVDSEPVYSTLAD